MDAGPCSPENTPGMKETQQVEWKSYLREELGKDTIEVVVEFTATMMPRMSRTLLGISSMSFAASLTPTAMPRSSRPMISLPPSALAKPQIHRR